MMAIAPEFEAAAQAAVSLLEAQLGFVDANIVEEEGNRERLEHSLKASQDQ